MKQKVHQDTGLYNAAVEMLNCRNIRYQHM